MAIDLKAVFRVQDKGSAQLRKLTKSMEQVDKASRNISKSSNASGKAFSALGSTAASAASGVGRLKSSLGGMVGAVAGVAGAYLLAQGAIKAFNATIGEAARYEQAEVAVHAIFNDRDASNAYLKMVDKMAIDSPLLNSGEMLANSKSLVSMTKDVEQLGKAWSIVERLMVLDPTQGTEGAAFALKEMWQGDAMSMIERFGLNRGQLNEIKKLSIPEQISAINSMLDGMGITQSTVEAMGATTLGYWAQIQERVDKFMRTLGGDGNSKLGKALEGIVNAMDGMDMDATAKKLGDYLGGIVDKAIEVGKWLWKWKEPIAYATAAVGAALTAFVAVGAIAALANPVTLIAAGIAALAVGFVALYNNSAPVREVIDGIVNKAKELVEAFKSGGASGLLDALLPPGAVEAMSVRFAAIKEQLAMAFESIKSIVVPILQAAWGLISPILTALGTALKIVADVAMIAWNNVLAPAIEFVGAAFTMMWGIVGPILELLGATIEMSFSVLRFMWDTVIGPFVAFLGGAFATAFGMATEVVGALTPVFETLGGWISTAAGYLREFADLIGNIKVPDWIGSISSSAVGWAKSLIPGKSRADGSHFHGLDRVPYDGYLATLHRNEMVLKADEADAYRKMLTNDSQTSEAVSTPITPMINNVLEPNINIAVNPAITMPTVNNEFNPVLPELQNVVNVLPTVSDVFNEIVVTPVVPSLENIVNILPSVADVFNEIVVSPAIPTLENVINVLPAVADVFNEIVVKQPQMSAGDSIVSNDYSYERVSESITNQTTNNTYNNTTNQTTNNAVSGKQAQSQRPVTIQMHGVTVREEADIDMIGWALFERLAAAEGAGV